MCWMANVLANGFLRLFSLSADQDAEPCSTPCAMLGMFFGGAVGARVTCVGEAMLRSRNRQLFKLTWS